jgi:putative transposase
VPVSAKIRFSSNILPRWAQWPRNLDALLPVLYPRGILMGDLQEALTALLGPEASNLSLSVGARLIEGVKFVYGIASSDARETRAA